MLGMISTIARRLRRTMQKHGREELPLTQGQGQRRRVPGCDGAGAAERSYPMPQVRGGGREELPHVQGAAAVWVQEGREELLHIQDLLHVQGQEGWS